ncbi:MAG: adenylate kinase [Longimicrobiales bacterium]|nr:adenylate kinase [Longimicrobiales bacterium]
MVVVLLGPPGVGKGTQAVRLAEERAAAHVSTGDLLRAARREGTELGRKAQGFMDRGELVPDDLILDLVREHLAGLDDDAPVLFDGFPRTEDQATGLDRILKEVGRSVDLVVLFEADDEVLVKRLSGRRSCPEDGSVYNVYFSPPEKEGVCDRCGSALIQRKDDEAETVTRRLQVYQDETAPLIAFYAKHSAPLKRIAADRDVEEIYEDFEALVRRRAEAVEAGPTGSGGGS